MQFSEQQRGVGALLLCAIGWGLLWLPYRALDALGISGAVAVLSGYGLAFIAGWWLLLRRQNLRWYSSPLLLAMALSGGWANVAYTLGVLEGEVMQVLLLMYLAPLWTAGLAHWLLGEHLTRMGYGIVLLALLGAIIMLYPTDHVWNFGPADWYGVSSGIAFALVNILVKKAAHHPAPIRTLHVWAGVVACSWLPLAFGSITWPSITQWQAASYGLLLTAVWVFLLGVVVQYGILRVSANQGVVVMLFELPVAAISAWWFAGESLTFQQILGGGFIVAAGLFSHRMTTPSLTTQ